jgi:hypothetical protein
MRDHSFTVTVDTGSFTRSSRGQIAGVVYATVDGRAFPEASWSDAIVPILSSWLELLLDLANGTTGNVSLYFMDGPFRMDIANGEERWHITAIDGRGGERVVSEADVRAHDAIAAVRESVGQTLNACSERTWWSPEIDRLVRLSTLASEK